MDLRIALAGNPNSGKTTLFNALTGSNQFVGNWPGVTVEKKEGKLKKHDGVIITDLPGIYSLSPYTLEEVVARNYLIDERPDAILNIIDGTNLERNLYLTTQLTELGIPVVIAINMMDVVRKNGDKINVDELSRQLGCKIVEISALKGDGVMTAAEAAIEAAKNTKTLPMHTFEGSVEHALAHIEEAAVHGLPEEQQRWYAIKIFERDDKVLAKLNLDKATLEHIEGDIKEVEKEMDDDAESIITNERYIYIASIIKACYKKKNVGQLSTSDKIDKVVTNRWLGLPIFAVIMFLVYYISMVTVGSFATDWMNDGVFGDGWHLLGIGSKAYSTDADDYTAATEAVSAFTGIDFGAEDFDADKALAEMKAYQPTADTATVDVEDEETLAVNAMTAYYSAIPANLSKADKEATVGMTYVDAVKYLEEKGFDEPDPAAYGVWVPGIPVLVGNGLEKVGAADWLSGLINDGIVAGVGAVLGFVPQMLVLFLLLAFLEACGYMARIAFVLDRIFRKFGLSGKSFIPMLIGTGCGVPGIMASRTIENERDRRMTIMTTTFIPCGAKVPFIAMIAGALFGGSALVSTSAYFIGMAAIICSGIMLKKTKMFSGDPAPFVILLLAFLEACGYMARIAFVLDRIFRKFGLSGKSFIPMLIGTGCGVPGIMASRTIENERDRRMTIMTTTFIPCGAKVPFIAMIAGALFGGSALVSTSAYFIGMAAIICSGIMLKKTKMFSGDPAPFVMELPAYHWPTLKNVLRSMWERGWSFIKKAGTIILLSTIVVWFTSYFGFVDGHFGMLAEDQLDQSLLAKVGSAIAWIFVPLGWGNWQATVASITGLVAKENIVGTMGILYGAEGNVYATLAKAFTGITAYSFLVFNLLCAPCFAAIGAIKREMNSAKWTWFAIGYQCGFAYVISLMINQFGNLFTGNIHGAVDIVSLVFAFIFLALIIFMLVRPYKEATKLASDVKVTK